jgi:hypothetical protein
MYLDRLQEKSSKLGYRLVIVMIENTIILLDDTYIS